MNSSAILLVTSMTLLTTPHALAQRGDPRPQGDACIELGALAFDDWTRLDAGGSGLLPAGEPLRDYLRCVSCHGWDRLGEFGGDIRRPRTAEQPNTGWGDPNTVSRLISPGLGNFFDISVEQVLHEGFGRAFEEGSGSWVPLDPVPSPENTDDHWAGYVRGNLHPDFSDTGSNAGEVLPTTAQLECIVEFVNFGNADPQFYFHEIEQDQDPVRYEINSGASALAGRTFYDGFCRDCHGEPAQDFQGLNDGEPDGGILLWLSGDGRYSELAHIARWGIPDSTMTRAFMGSPDSQNIIDLMRYLQDLLQEEDVLFASGFEEDER